MQWEDEEEAAEAASQKASPADPRKKEQNETFWGRPKRPTGSFPTILIAPNLLVDFRPRRTDFRDFERDKGQSSHFLKRRKGSEEEGGEEEEEEVKEV